MSACGVSGDIDPIPVPTVFMSMLPDPGQRSAVLAHDLVHVAARCQTEIGDDRSEAVWLHPLGNVAVVRLVEGIPVPAVDEHIDGSTLFLARKDIELLGC